MEDDVLQAELRERFADVGLGGDSVDEMISVLSGAPSEG